MGGRKGTGWVYFFQQGQTGPIKIGFTTNLLERMESLQIASPHELRCLCNMRAFPHEEREIHARFRKHRIRGEWFDPCPELLAFMEEKR